MNTDSSKFLLIELFPLGCFESNIWWLITSSRVSLSNSNLSCLRKTLAKYIFTKYSRNMTLIARYMLKAELMTRSRDPRYSFFAGVTKDVLRLLIPSNVGPSSWSSWIKTYSLCGCLGMYGSPRSLLPSIIDD